MRKILVVMEYFPLLILYPTLVGTTTFLLTFRTGFVYLSVDHESLRELDNKVYYSLLSNSKKDFDYQRKFI